MRVGVDLMGGDQPPPAIFEAVLQLTRELNSSSELVVFAQHEVFSVLKKQYTSFLEECEPTLSSIEFITTDESIEHEDSPLLAVRRKKNSSLAAGMKLLASKSLDAFVSTGNTGALVATAIHYLPMLPSISRPALLVTLPAGKKNIAVLDVGAQISLKPEQLIDFGKLGIAYQQCAFGLRRPSLGLLNIGSEEKKGTKAIKEAYSILQDYFNRSPNHFLGNIEGREVFQGKVDILITDGFTGNIFLKTCEGVTSFLLEYFNENFAHSGSQELRKIFSHLYQNFNYSEHPGAILCGVDGLVIKCHGYSNTAAVMSGIRGAIALSKKNLIKKMRAKLEKA